MSTRTGNDTVQTFSAARRDFNDVFPFPPGELEEKEYDRRHGLLHERLVAQILSHQFELDEYQEGVHLFLLPIDDPAMTRMTLERAMRVEAGGGRVNLRIIHPTKIVAS